jgi:hypothetical protein
MFIPDPYHEVAQDLQLVLVVDDGRAAFERVRESDTVDHRVRQGR